MVVGRYNSVVDGMQNYYSLASQISDDFGSVQRSLRLRMYHKIKGLTAEMPKELKLSAKDEKFLQSKQTRYLHGQMVHPIGYVKNRTPQGSYERTGVRPPTNGEFSLYINSTLQAGFNPLFGVSKMLYSP